MNKIISLFKEDPVWALFLFFVFFSGFSTPIARFFLAVCSIIYVIKIVRCREKVLFNTPSWGWLVFSVFVIIVSIIAYCLLNDPLLDSTRSLKKLRKLVWFMGIPIAATLVNSKERFNAVLRWFILGSLILAVYVILMYPIHSWIILNFPRDNQMASIELRKTIPLLAQWIYNFCETLGIKENISEWVFSFKHKGNYVDVFSRLGNMGDAQCLMVAVIIAFYFFISAYKNKRQISSIIKNLIFFWVLFLALLFVGRRGTIFSAIFLMVPLILYYCKRFSILIFILLIGVIFIVPSLRLRICSLQDELIIERGGRYMMWTQIVPNIHEEHPYGIGFMSLTTDKMRQYAPRMENKYHTHVHSTVLQMFVDFGWAGIFIYLFWMILSIIPPLMYLKRGAGLFAFVPLQMFLALFLFSFVEYNITATTPALFYVISMGLCDCTFLRQEFSKKL